MQISAHKVKYLSDHIKYNTQFYVAYLNCHNCIRFSFKVVSFLDICLLQSFWLSVSSSILIFLFVRGELFLSMLADSLPFDTALDGYRMVSEIAFKLLTFVIVSKVDFVMHLPRFFLNVPVLISWIQAILASLLNKQRKTNIKNPWKTFRMQNM